MKKTLFIYLVFAFAVVAKGESKLEADSIKIIGCDRYYETQMDVGKYLFIDKYLNTDYSDVPEEALPNYVNHTITSKIEIEEILNPLYKLKPQKKLKHKSNERVEVLYYFPSRRHAYWIEDTELDLRLALIIYRRDKVEFVWIGYGLLERDGYLYKTDNLESVLKKYTHLFD